MTSSAAFVGATSSVSQGASAGMLQQIPSRRRNSHVTAVVREACVSGSEDDIRRRSCTPSDTGAGGCVSSRIGSSKISAWALQIAEDSRRRRRSACESMTEDRTGIDSNMTRRRRSSGPSLPRAAIESPATCLSTSTSENFIESLLSKGSSRKNGRRHSIAGICTPVQASMSSQSGRHGQQEASRSTICSVLARDMDALTAPSEADLSRVPDHAAGLRLRLAYESSCEPALSDTNASAISRANNAASDRLVGKEDSVMRKEDSDKVGVAEDEKPNSSRESGQYEDDSGALSMVSEGPAKRTWWEKIVKNLPNPLQLTPRTRGLVLFNLLSILWGSNISVVKGTTDVLDPAAFCALRFSIAALAFSPWLWNAVTNKTVRQAGVELGLWGGAGYLSLAIGLVTTDAGRASFISIFSVIVVPILAGIFGAKIPKVTWFSAVAAVAGVGLLESSGPGSLTGDLWTFASALLFGVLILRQEHYSHNLSSDKEFGKDGALSVIGLQLVVYAVSASVWVAVSHLSAGDSGILGEIAAGDWSGLEHTLAGFPWFATVYTGLFSTALCLWIEITAMCDITATEAAMVYTLEPVWGAAFAWVLLGERWGPQGWVGAALIIGGSAAMQVFGKMPEQNVLEVSQPTAPVPVAVSDVSPAQGIAAKSALNGSITSASNGATVTVASNSPCSNGNGSGITSPQKRSGSTVKVSKNSSCRDISGSATVVPQEKRGKEKY